MSYYAILDDIPCRPPCNRYNLFTFGVLTEYVVDRQEKDKNLSLTDIMKSPSSLPNSTKKSVTNPVLDPNSSAFETYQNLGNLGKCNCSVYNRPESDTKGYNKSLTWKDQEYFRKNIQNKSLV